MAGGAVGGVAEIGPATSMVEVRRLIDPALLVEIEADAVVRQVTRQRLAQKRFAAGLEPEQLQRRHREGCE